MKWLPHNGNARQEDGAGPARMVYASVADFANSQLTEAVRRGGAFVPRHAASRDKVDPMPHTVVISDIAPGGWYSVMTSTGVQGMDVLRRARWRPRHARTTAGRAHCA